VTWGKAWQLATNTLKSSKNLCTLMTSTNNVSLEKQRGIQTVNRCLFGLRKHLQSTYLSRQTKFTIHKTLIRRVPLYDSETCVLTKREENRLLVFPGKPSSDTHDQIRKITLKTTTAKTTTCNRKKFVICLREKTMIDYVICTAL
jgi:hypothetical protein